LTRDLIGTWSALELLWTGLALIGLAFSSVNIRDRVLDLLSLGGRKNGRRRLALGDIRREAVRIVYYLAAIVSGVLAGGQAAPPDGLTPAGLVIVSALVLMLVLQVSQSVFDRLDSAYLARYGLTPRDEKGRFTKND
jgi:hypothetical protein